MPTDDTVDRLLVLAAKILGDWPDECGMDGFDAQDALVEAGILEPSKVTDADMADEWPCEWGMEPGDECFRLTPLGERARKLLNAKEPTR